MEINRNHTKANLSNIQKKLKRGLVLGGLAITMTLCSGCGAKVNDEAVTNVNSGTIVHVNNSQKQAASSSDIDYSATKVYASSDKNLDYLNNYTNLKSLDITGAYGEADGVFDNLNLPDLESISIADTKKDISFLKNCNKLQSVSLQSLDISSIDFLYDKDIKELKICNCENIQEFDPDRFPSLEKITFDYSVNKSGFLKYLTTSDISKMEQRGIEIDYKVDANQIKGEAAKLDEIVQSLPVDKNSSDTEKIDAILTYVINNTEYDYRVEEDTKEGKDLLYEYNSDELRYALDDDKLGVCVNYSSLTSALANRLGVESYNAFNTKHVWNLVKVDNDYYFFDPLWIDEQGIEITDANKEKINWYQVDVNYGEIESIDRSSLHKYVTVPSDIVDKLGIPSTDEYSRTLKSSGNPDINVKYGGQEFATNLYTFVGIMTGLGVAMESKKFIDRCNTVQEEREIISK